MHLKNRAPNSCNGDVTSSNNSGVISVSSSSDVVSTSPSFYRDHSSIEEVNLKASPVKESFTSEKNFNIEEVDLKASPVKELMYSRQPSPLMELFFLGVGACALFGIGFLGYRHLSKRTG